MSPEEHESLLSERPIKMLVVEKKIDYLDAAEMYFERVSKRTPFYYDLALGIKGAKKRIRQCFENREPYDYVFTAMELEEKLGGFEVIREALMHGTLAFLISDIPYKDPISPYFKPNTKIDAPKESHLIREKRDSSQVWEEITLYAATFYVHRKGKKLMDRISEQEEFPIRRDSEIIRQVISQYIDSSLSRTIDDMSFSGGSN